MENAMKIREIFHLKYEKIKQKPLQVYLLQKIEEILINKKDMNEI